MHIEHIAIWCKDIEQMKTFYTKYFHATANNKYHNHAKKFTSYFLNFGNGARLELMQMENISERMHGLTAQYTGIAHFAISLGSKERVDDLTQQLKQDGYILLDGPRTTGDGYYESVIMDPEQNRIELTV